MKRKIKKAKPWRERKKESQKERKKGQNSFEGRRMALWLDDKKNAKN